MQVTVLPIQNTSSDVLWALFKALLIFGVSAIALYFAVLVGFYVIVALVHAVSSLVSGVWRAIPTRALTTAQVSHPQTPVKTKPRLRLVKG